MRVILLKKEKVLCERESLLSDMSLRSGKKDTKMRIRAFPVSVSLPRDREMPLYKISALLQSTVMLYCLSALSRSYRIKIFELCRAGRNLGIWRDLLPIQT